MPDFEQISRDQHMVNTGAQVRTRGRPVLMVRGRGRGVVASHRWTGAERKQTKYRMRSGCDEWDKPVASPNPHTGAHSGLQAWRTSRRTMSRHAP